GRAATATGQQERPVLTGILQMVSGHYVGPASRGRGQRSCAIPSTRVCTSGIDTLSLPDALPISGGERMWPRMKQFDWAGRSADGDRKSTRLNSSHVSISYAVFCLKKKSYSVT